MSSIPAPLPPLPVHIVHDTHALTAGVLIANATPVVKLIMLGSMAASVAALGLLVLGLVTPQRPARGLGFLSATTKAGPMLGALAMAYGLANSFLGVANTNTTNIAVIAPGVAEALFAVTLGLVCGVTALFAHAVLTERQARPAAA